MYPIMQSVHEQDRTGQAEGNTGVGNVLEDRMGLSMGSVARRQVRRCNIRYLGTQLRDLRCGQTSNHMAADFCWDSWETVSGSWASVESAGHDSTLSVLGVSLIRCLFKPAEGP